MKGLCWFRTDTPPRFCAPYITPNKLYMNSQWDDVRDHVGYIIDDAGDELVLYITKSIHINGGSWEVVYPADL